MAPSPIQKQQAEKRKAEGNQLFSKGKFGPAAESYTEAICLDPTYAVLYVNRGMCYKKACRWDQVVKDATKALSLNSSLMKAHYLLGVAQRELQNLPDAIAHLTKALEAAREKGDSIKDEIWRELAKAKYAAWQQDSQQRSATAAALKQQLESMLKSQWLQGCVADATGSSMAEQQAGPDSSSKGSTEQQQQLVRQQWEQLMQRAAHLDVKAEVPTAFTCPLTMEIFRDPVITPAGFSYERSALLEHLSKVGCFDPISRKEMTASEVTPNIALRNATQQYLEEHPWAWGECI